MCDVYIYWSSRQECKDFLQIFHDKYTVINKEDDFNSHFSKEHIHMASKHMKQRLTLLVIVSQIRTTMRCYLTSKMDLLLMK